MPALTQGWLLALYFVYVPPLPTLGNNIMLPPQNKKSVAAEFLGYDHMSLPPERLEPGGAGKLGSWTLGTSHIFNQS